jgi:hypothetical protein
VKPNGKFDISALFDPPLLEICNFEVLSPDVQSKKISRIKNPKAGLQDFKS